MPLDAKQSAPRPPTHLPARRGASDARLVRILRAKTLRGGTHRLRQSGPIRGRASVPDFRRGIARPRQDLEREIHAAGKRLVVERQTPKPTQLPLLRTTTTVIAAISRSGETDSWMRLRSPRASRRRRKCRRFEKAIPHGKPGTPPWITLA